MKHLIAVGRVEKGAATIKVEPFVKCPRCHRLRDTIIHRPAGGVWCDVCELALTSCCQCRGVGCARCKGTGKEPCVRCKEKPATVITKHPVQRGVIHHWCDECFEEEKNGE